MVAFRVTLVLTGIGSAFLGRPGYAALNKDEGQTHTKHRHEKPPSITMSRISSAEYDLMAGSAGFACR